MKRNLLTILLALIFALTLCIVACADELVDWTMSEDEKTLIVGDESYTIYQGYIAPSDKLLPKYKFLYDKELDYYYRLIRNNDNMDIMIVSPSSNDIEYVFVNNQGKLSLDEFAKGNFSSYIIANKSFTSYMDISNQWVEGLDGGATVEIAVRTLKDCTVYNVLGYDSTRTLTHIVGGIYETESGYYFINYDKLPNNYFDADGNFSFRQGVVNAYKLNTMQGSDIDSYRKNATYFQTKYEEDVYEEIQHSGFSKGQHIAIFVLVTAIFGFIIPLVPAVIGIIRIVTHKAKNPKRWYLMFVSCGIWVLLAIGTLLSMIL